MNLKDVLNTPITVLVTSNINRRASAYAPYNSITPRLSVASTSQPFTGLQKHCHWRSPTPCTAIFETDRALYEHVKASHIGYKRLGNLNMACAWNNCAVVCSKRDHITSHIKVHVHVKMFSCHVLVCYSGKFFEQPKFQLLKTTQEYHHFGSVFINISSFINSANNSNEYISQLLTFLELRKEI